MRLCQRSPAEGIHCTSALLLGLLVTIMILVGGCSATARTGANSTTAPPKIVTAWFSDLQWNPSTGRYDTKLNLSYLPTEPPLHLEWFVTWKIGPDSGVSSSWGTQDISRFAKLAEKGQHFVKPWWFRFSGAEYTFTLRLRNPAGVAEIDLPTVKVP